MRTAVTSGELVYLEVGASRTFAGALEWPGWCRAGRSEEQALVALLSYGDRYARVVAGSDPSFGAPRDLAALQVLERLGGNAGTDFGVPGIAPAADERTLDEAELERQVRLLAACWEAFDKAVQAATGRELRTGPRGGGRGLAKMVAHVSDAEAAYLHQLGAKAPGDPDAARQAIRETLRARALGLPLARSTATRNPWSPRYFVRRAAWHLLDHAWELEDRTIA
jgi:hypothetical protein